MPTLTKEKIINILGLRNHIVVGEILESLIEPYTVGDHRKFLKDVSLPPFIEKLLGPQLERLPSFASLEQKEEHAELLAIRNHQSGLEGLGEIVDTIHYEIRLSSANIGKLLKPEAMKHLAEPNFRGKVFSPAEAEKLEGIDTITIALAKELPPLTIHSPDILYKAFLLGASARATLSRSLAERKLIKLNVGEVIDAYSSSLDLANAISEAMARSSDYQHQSAIDYNLVPDIDKIAERFFVRQDEFKNTYNFLYVATMGELYSGLENLKWAIEGKKKPSQGIEVSTPAEAASLLAGLTKLLGIDNPKNTWLCEQIFRGSNENAALLLQRSSIIKELLWAADQDFVPKENTGLSLDVQKDYHERRKTFAHRTIPLLEQFRQQHAVRAPVRAAERSASSQISTC